MHRSVFKHVRFPNCIYLILKITYQSYALYYAIIGIRIVIGDCTLSIMCINLSQWHYSRTIIPAKTCCQHHSLSNVQYSKPPPEHPFKQEKIMSIQLNFPDIAVYDAVFALSFFRYELL